MKKFNFHYFPRDFEAGNFIENFLVASVSSILVIRVFLALTGYPQVGIREFHLAHMLFGGFVMMFTLIGLLVFLNREVKIIASVTGGIGFGYFIDELGKFITRDYNYFYQPTIALIYVIFVTIFLVARIFEKYAKLTETEYAINALEIAKNVLLHDLDSEEKQRALYLLKKASPDYISKALEIALRETKAKPHNDENIFHKLKTYFKNLYFAIIHHKYFVKIIVGFFIITSVMNFFEGLLNFKRIENFADWGQLIFSIVSGVMVIIGIQFLIYKSSRRIAYEMFKYSVLISIFLTQFFRFLEDQLSATISLVLSLIVLSALQYLIYEESVLRAKKKLKAHPIPVN